MATQKFELSLDDLEALYRKHGADYASAKQMAAKELARIKAAMAKETVSFGGTQGTFGDVQVSVSERNLAVGRIFDLQREGWSNSDALKMVAYEILRLRGESETPFSGDALALELRKSTPTFQEEPLFILSKKIEREEGLAYGDAMVEASRQLAAIKKDQREKLAALAPPEQVCGNCRWCLRLEDTGCPTACNFNPAALPVEERRAGCSKFELIRRQ